MTLGRTVEVAGMPACRILPGSGPVVAAAVHAGSAVREDLRGEMMLPAQDRLREEDPHTWRFVPDGIAAVVGERSRFEVDLNRPRERAVYLSPEDAWGLDVWARPPGEDVVRGSLEVYDAFYAELRALLDERAAHGPFVLLDLHSYNHRRSGALAPPDDPAANPEVNLGTGTLDAVRWRRVAEAFVSAMAERGHDVRENVRFRGGAVSAWVNAEYAGRGCALAVEFKKTFMDEWTGAVDDGAVEAIRESLGSTVPRLVAALARIRP